MKEKMLTSDVVKLVYDVIAERRVKAIDADCLLMSALEYTITDRLSEEHVTYVMNTYKNALIYKRDKIQCVAVFPRSLNLLYSTL